MINYEITVSATISKSWEADSKDEALRKAEAWVAETYGDLIYKANFTVKEL